MARLQHEAYMSQIAQMVDRERRDGYEAAGRYVGRATSAQQREHERLREQGVMVYVIDNVVMGKFMVDKMRLMS